ncbi:hypothetical protein E1262_13725 [Jiangella aurantiaca]|uniref:Phage holin family protein n=1 Tax=Jiangella aurantiaca TaxID=2530373 RepID=A0A4R5A9Y1_9ACTN|nr:hypothetical protein [Jiangella aurantiaca]TDD69083.1 hypothetical protein E1262_13725 [Jiangella aurantiaca]
MKWLIRLVLAAAANGVLFLIAAVLFDEFSLSFTGWLVGTALFTFFTMLLRSVMAALARKYASSATFLGGVALAWVGLLLTDLFTSRENFDLEGVGTWVFVTLIVWVGTVIYDQVDDRLIDAVHNRSKGRPAST